MFVKVLQLTYTWTPRCVSHQSRGYQHSPTPDDCGFAIRTRKISPDSNLEYIKIEMQLSGNHNVPMRDIILRTKSNVFKGN